VGKIRKYSPVKLIIGCIYSDEQTFLQVRDRLRRKFGKIDFQSEALDFNYTDYYAQEMGTGLKRRFVSFQKLVPLAYLYRAKLYTNRLELKFLSGGRRKVNIDPGYVDLAKLVLASTKDYAHRIYLHKGIFAEITLSFKDNSFSPNAWTYPDYRTEEYIKIFNQIRSLYAP